MMYARKNVVVRMNGDEVHAEALKYDLKKRHRHLQDAFGTAHNVTLYHNAIDDALFFWAPRILWDSKAMRLYRRMTSCDLPPGRNTTKSPATSSTSTPVIRMEIRKARPFMKTRKSLAANCSCCNCTRADDKISCHSPGTTHSTVPMSTKTLFSRWVHKRTGDCLPISTRRQALGAGPN